MEEIVEKVSAAPYVTVMDLSKGYFQIPLTPRAQRYAAFVTPFGTYIPKKMMFGLVCAPYYFCKLMAQVLEGLEQFALPYIDDIAIFPKGGKIT
ncbi:retrovirus-related Pol polyprotein from transposon 297 [Trichonephila clavipes]|nr:retrovirus-related Pol polyprotein from transposon 297 [Trichonephila clavipes]